jgi:hypothetical protein
MCTMRKGVKGLEMVIPTGYYLLVAALGLI